MKTMTWTTSTCDLWWYFGARRKIVRHSLFRTCFWRDVCGNYRLQNVPWVLQKKTNNQTFPRIGSSNLAFNQALWFFRKTSIVCPQYLDDTIPYVSQHGQNNAASCGKKYCSDCKLMSVYYK